MCLVKNDKAKYNKVLCPETLSDYFSPRIFGPLSGAPNKGANTQKSNRPAASGTMPITATTMPIVPVSPSNPQAMSATPATMRVIRPAVEAINLTKGFIFYLLLLFDAHIVGDKEYLVCDNVT
jgi:hypothetical protein